MQWISLHDCFTPWKNFPSGNPRKILSHLRILEKGPVRAYRTPLEFSKAQPLSQAPLSEASPSSQGFCWLLWDWLCYCNGYLIAPISATSDFGALNNYHHPIGYSGWGSKGPWSFRVKESSASHWTSKDLFRLTSNLSENQNEKQQPNFFLLSGLSQILSISRIFKSWPCNLKQEGL